MKRITRHDSRVVALSALFSYHLAGVRPDESFRGVASFFPAFFGDGSSPVDLSAFEFPASHGAVASRSASSQDSVSSYVQYAKDLFLSAVTHLDDLDRLIDAHSEGWTVSRMPLVDRCILELALAELKYAGDAPMEVVLDEAVNLAREFGTADSPAFVNGLLMGIIRATGLNR